ncbi:hypothetical protein ACQPVP_05875 [Clostridium nigeriense]|uniref:hypothetical protein n=1 Tax=Clostridium nigeriense TaxID=1805470 RepID=UPI003D354CBC
MKKRAIYFGISIIAICLISFSVYQYNKINTLRSILKNTIKYHIEMFASSPVNLNDELAYSQKYGNIVAAQSAYIALKEGRDVPSKGYDISLSRLFIEIKGIMINNGEKIEKITDDRDMRELMLNIANNIEDTNSIERILEIIQ